ncbi:MAG TPA: redox-regulated ATPase YchF [Bacillota bacterium]|nr:redox-regulated ATPase YchF [Bacillota bacterium]
MNSLLTCGIVGLPGAGKSTLFNLLTGAEGGVGFGAKRESRTQVASVPDPRLDFFVQMYKPKKVSPAQIQFTDLPGFEAGKGREFLDQVRPCDALLLVLRAFESPLGENNPVGELNQLSGELVLADWELVEKRLERLAANKKKTADKNQEPALRKLAQALEEGKPARTVELTEEEAKALEGLELLSAKPAVVVVNLAEDSFGQDYPARAAIDEICAENLWPKVEVCAQLELEIAALPSEEREIFLADLGISQPGIDLVAQAAYKSLDLISYFTVGEDEVKAWTIRRGTNAQDAAGKIHSDIARGFIRAEVFHYEDLREHKTIANLRQAGLFRLEGKEYIVQDGDVMSFRFNV